MRSCQASAQGQWLQVQTIRVAGTRPPCNDVDRSLVSRSTNGGARSPHAEGRLEISRLLVVRRSAQMLDAPVVSESEGDIERREAAGTSAPIRPAGRTSREGPASWRLRRATGAIPAPASQVRPASALGEPGPHRCRRPSGRQRSGSHVVAQRRNGGRHRPRARSARGRSSMRRRQSGACRGNTAVRISLVGHVAGLGQPPHRSEPSRSLCRAKGRHDRRDTG